MACASCPKKARSTGEPHGSPWMRWTSVTVRGCACANRRRTSLDATRCLRGHPAPRLAAPALLLKARSTALGVGQAVDALDPQVGGLLVGSMGGGHRARQTVARLLFDLGLDPALGYLVP